jgi:hypothetical protein
MASVLFIRPIPKISIINFINFSQCTEFHFTEIFKPLMKWEHLGLQTPQGRSKPTAPSCPAGTTEPATVTQKQGRLSTCPSLVRLLHQLCATVTNLELSPAQTSFQISVSDTYLFCFSSVNNVANFILLFSVLLWLCVVGRDSKIYNFTTMM